MKPITGAGIAGVLMIAGGTSATALAMSANAEDPLGATSTVTTDDDPTDVEGTEPTQDDVQGTTDDADEVEGTEPEDASQATGTDPSEDTGTGSVLGLQHAAAMKLWTACVADAASGPRTDGQPMPPKLACGDKPKGPGQIKRLAGTTTESETAGSDTTEPASTNSPAASAAQGDDGAGRRIGAGHRGWGHHGAGHQGRSHRHHG